MRTLAPLQTQQQISNTFVYKSDEPSNLAEISAKSADIVKCYYLLANIVLNSKLQIDHFVNLKSLLRNAFFNISADTAEKDRNVANILTKVCQHFVILATVIQAHTYNFQNLMRSPASYDVTTSSRARKRSQIKLLRWIRMRPGTAGIHVQPAIFTK